ncbi:cobalt-precorrin 5A hydrolase [Candidatus Magnetomoraceae bacterium gMMP-15]
MYIDYKKNNLAVWAITPKGSDLAQRIVKNLPDSDLYISLKLEQFDIKCFTFNSLLNSTVRQFNKYQGHIFIMSTGIVVRLIAPLIKHKTKDPAVVVLDEMGNYAISLLSGHIGGANALAEKIAKLINAQPVITTATDINNMPAIDVIAKEKGLVIENPEAIKNVNMAFLTGKKVFFYDPYQLLVDAVKESGIKKDGPGVFIDDVVTDIPKQSLILRPKTLTAGIGCNRNTDKEEIKSLLFKTLKRFNLAQNSLKYIATITIKKDEQGISELAKELNLQIKYFDKEELNKVDNIQSPSAMVEKHIGVKSVCEAAAILAANQGKLIVPKQITKNATVAIARIFNTS